MPPYQLIKNTAWDALKDRILKLSLLPVPKSAALALDLFLKECNENWTEADNCMTAVDGIFRKIWTAYSQISNVKSSWTRELMRFHPSWVERELERLKILQEMMIMSILKGKGSALIREIREVGQNEVHNQLIFEVEQIVMALFQNIDIFFEDMENQTKSLKYQSDQLCGPEWDGIVCCVVILILSLLLWSAYSSYIEMRKFNTPLILLGTVSILTLLMILFPESTYESFVNWFNF